MKKQVIIGNWKMNKNLEETKKFIEEFNNLVKRENFNFKDNLIAGIALPFTSLSVQKTKAFKNIQYIAQNFNENDSGAFTGEISANMLQNLDVKMVILGHSERRHFFNETDEIVNKKMHQAIKNNLIPIICIGETEKEYNKNISKEIIKKQIKNSLKNLTDYKKIIVAYEPIWAIGTGKIATSEYAQKMCHYIRSLTHEDLVIQYGGSVKPDNIKEILSQKDINGVLVGGASLLASDFLKLLQ